MYLSKIEIDRTQLYWAVRKIRGGIYAEHQMIWEVMPRDPDAKRDFLYCKDIKGELPVYYLLSERKPIGGLDYLSIVTKSYKPELNGGDQLYFNLRANAVVTRKAGDMINRRIRRDIIDAKVDEYKAKGIDAAQWPSSAQIRYEAGNEWLQKQGKALGFEVLALTVQNHQHHEFGKPKTSNDLNRRQFASVDFEGRLVVTDAEAFVNRALFSGIGRARAYGCGLMLVKRV